MAVRLTRIVLQIAVDESAPAGQEGNWTGAPELASGWAYQNGTWAGAPELYSTWRTEKIHITRIALQIAVDESVGVDVSGEWAGAPELRCDWETLLATSEWAGHPELRSTWYTLPPGNHADGWQGDPELYCVWTATVSPQLGAWISRPELFSEWDAELSTTGRWQANPELRSEWMPRHDGVGLECITDAGNLHGEQNYVY